MIDFTGLPKKNKSYAGANGSKISVVYEGEQYMLKFPSYSSKNGDMSYSNSCISEYLGCRIFESVGIPVQETMLGTYTTDKSGKKIVVACKDFTSVGVVLQDFASLKNQIIDSERNGYGTELDFDCGSSLYPQADEGMIAKVLVDKREIHHRIFNIPLSAIQTNGKKINYYEFITSLENEDCNRALRRILPRVDMKRIAAIIDETPAISDLQKEFYKTMLAARKERILDYSMELLHKREKRRTWSGKSE